MLGNMQLIFQQATMEKVGLLIMSDEDDGHVRQRYYIYATFEISFSVFLMIS